MCVVHSRFGAASGQTHTSFTSDGAVQHNSQMAAKQPCHRPQLVWCLTLSVLMLSSLVLAIWLKWHALSRHKSPHTVTVHGVSRVASHDWLECQPDSIASNIYPSNGTEATIKASTRLWPPELECMAQTILAHARAARVLHGFPDMPPKADSPGHACATQQAVHPSQGCVKQAVTVQSTDTTDTATAAMPTEIQADNLYKARSGRQKEYVKKEAHWSHPELIQNLLSKKTKVF
ncbi:hypothetical protein WJX79_004959 [Trebouxia sp. C0005]